jgi:allophanate hydrolase subunit 1
MAGRAFPFSQWAASMLGFAFGSPPAYERPERTLHGRLAVNEREPQRSSVARRAGPSPFGLMLTRGYFR